MGAGVGGAAGGSGSVRIRRTPAASSTASSTSAVLCRPAITTTSRHQVPRDRPRHPSGAPDPLGWQFPASASDERQAGLRRRVSGDEAWAQ